MITTTLAVIALAGGLSAGKVPSPGWQKDYAGALAVASSESKPVAVFIGRGQDTPEKMVKDGTIPTESVKLLHDKYVCVYIDTDTAGGKELSGRFELTEGIVISGPGGKYQAMRQSGQVTGADLTGKLTQYASAGQPQSTVTTGVSSAPVIYAGGYSSNNGVIYQGNYSAPVYQSSPLYYSNPNAFGTCTSFR